MLYVSLCLTLNYYLLAPCAQSSKTMYNTHDDFVNIAGVGPAFFVVQNYQYSVAGNHIERDHIHSMRLAD